MKINLKTSKTVDKICLEDLNGNVVYSDNNSDINLEYNWYLLSVVYTDEEFDIEDLLLNDESIKHRIYTGWFGTVDGEKHQPCQTLFAPGSWKIWIHGNIGYLIHTLSACINDRYYGKNLFDTHLCTVDRPIHLSNKGNYRPAVRDYFAHGFGPRWWQKDRPDIPYEILDVELPENKAEFANQVAKIIPGNQEQYRFEEAVTSNKMFTTKQSEASLHPLSVVEHDGLRKILEDVGFSEIYYLNVANMKPRSDIYIHVDSNDVPQGWEPHKNHLVKRLYIACAEEWDGLYFKMGEAGLLPLQSALMIHPCYHSHSVVNDTDSYRKVIMVQGIRDNLREKIGW